MTPEPNGSTGPRPQPGAVLAEFGPFPVEWGKAGEIAAATLDPNGSSRYRPAFADAEPPIAPPTYGMVQALWGASLDELGLGLEPTRILDGEYEFEYLRPIRVGDWLRGVTRYMGSRSKRGRQSSHFRLIDLETTFSDSDSGDPVLISRRTIVEFDEPPAWGRG